MELYEKGHDGKLYWIGDLCSWDFCDVCINYRIRSGLSLKDLKSKEGMKPYYRVENPHRKPSQPRLQDLKTLQEITKNK